MINFISIFKIYFFQVNVDFENDTAHNILVRQKKIK